jgi:hypothetical protein
MEARFVEGPATYCPARFRYNSGLMYMTVKLRRGKSKNELHGKSANNNVCIVNNFAVFSALRFQPGLNEALSGLCMARFAPKH